MPFLISNHQELVVQHARRVQKNFRGEFHMKIQNNVNQVKLEAEGEHFIKRLIFFFRNQNHKLMVYQN